MNALAVDNIDYCLYHLNNINIEQEKMLKLMCPSKDLLINTLKLAKEALKQNGK